MRQTQNVAEVPSGAGNRKSPPGRLAGLRVTVVTRHGLDGDSRLSHLLEALVAAEANVTAVLPAESMSNAESSVTFVGVPSVSARRPRLTGYAREIARRLEVARESPHGIVRFLGCASLGVLAPALTIGTLTRVAALDELLLKTRHRWLALRWGLSSRFVLDISRRFWRAVLETKPDVLWLMDAHMLLVGEMVRRDAFREGIRPGFVADIHHLRFTPRRELTIRKQSLSSLARRYLRDIDQVVAVSTPIARRAVRLGGLTVDPTIHPCTPRDEITPAPGRSTLRTELGLSKEAPLVVHNGGLDPTRGCESIVRAAERLSDVHIAFVSNPRDPHAPALLALAKELGISDRIHTVPYVPARSVLWYIRDADLGVCPVLRSPHHDSNVHTKSHEYAVAGLPQAVSDCTAQAEFVSENGIGEVFHAGDAAAAAEAIRTVLDNADELRKNLGPEMRRKWTFEYTEHVIIDAVLAAADQEDNSTAGTVPGGRPRS